MLKWVAAALAAAGLLAGGAPAGASEACKIIGLGELKVSMAGREPLVPVKINGVDTFLLVDSGAFFSIISTARADQLHLTRTYQTLRVAGVGGDEEAEVRQAKTFEIGGLKVTDTVFLSTGEEIGTEASGLLGENFLRLGDVEYDFSNGLIRLVRPTNCGPGEVTYWLKPGQTPNAIDIKPATLEHAHVEAYVFLNGVQLTAWFDTGAERTVVSLAGAHRARIPTQGPEVKPGGRSYGLGGASIPVVIAPVATVKIGDEEIRNTRISVAPVNSIGPDILIGADFFLSHHVYSSRADRKLYFVYLGGPVFSLSSDRKGSAPVAAGPQAPAVDPAISATPDGEGDAAARRGAAALARNDLDRAQKEFDAAVAAEPKNPRFRYERARARIAAKDVTGALADLDVVLGEHPSDPNALVLRATLLISRGRSGAASEDLARADAASQPPDNLRLELAAAHLRLGEYAAAISDDDGWIEAHPDEGLTGEARGRRCRAEVFANVNLERALADCTAALRASGDQDRTALASRGLIRYRRGENERALQDFEAALKLNPGASWARFGRGLVLVRLGRTEEGEKDLAAVLAKFPGVGRRARRIGLALPEGLSEAAGAEAPAGAPGAASADGGEEPPAP